MLEIIAEEIRPDGVAPKVEAFERLIESRSEISIADFAKSIGWGRNELFYQMRERGILDADNIPYQKYMQYFVVRHRVVSGMNFPTSYLNSRGVVYFQKIFR
jgi:phage antirepressor YoqD-like protein